MKRPQLFFRQIIAYSFIFGILLQPFQNMHAAVQQEFADTELSLEKFIELVRDQLSYEELAEIIETHKDDLDADGNPDTRAWFKIYANLTVRGRLNAGNLRVRNDALIQGNLTVDGTINGSGMGDVTGPASSTLNAVARYADTTGKVIKNSSVLVDDAGNITIDGITKNGNTVSWPSIVGAANTVLTSDGAGNLVYSTPAGGGNVSTAANFTTNNAIITVDLPSGAHNIKQTPVILDGAGNITGVNNLTVNGVTTFNNTAVLNNHNTLKFVDAGGINFVGLSAPNAVTSSYTISLPATGPMGAGQVVTAISSSATEWRTIGISQTIYVDKAGNDITGNGTFTAPYASLKRALVDANAVATPTHPVQISIGAGVFIEDNSAGPLTVNPATSGGVVNIVGTSELTTLLIAGTTSQNFLALPVSASLSNLQIAGASSAVGVVASGANNTSYFLNVLIEACGQGVSLSGGPTTGYYLNGVTTIACGTGLVVTSARAFVLNHVFFGTTSVPTPMFAGCLVTGSDALVAIEAALFYYCTTGLQVSNSANMQFIGSTFTGNIIALQCDTGSRTTPNSLTFLSTSSINIHAQDVNTFVQATGCNIDGLSATNIPAGTGLQVSNGAQVNIASSSFDNLVDGIIAGLPADSSPAKVLASSVVLQNCTDKQIIQNDASVLAFIGGSFDRSQVVIGAAGNATFNTSDTSSDNATIIGQHADITQDVIIIDTGELFPPALTYQKDYNGATGLVYINATGDATVLGVESTTRDAQLSAVTGQNDQAALVQLYSGNVGSIPMLPALSPGNLRGWELVKTATTANLAFNFMNNDSLSTTTVNKYTSFYADGFNNVLNFPSTTGSFAPTNATTVLNWGQDSLPSTNLYRASTGLLQTDANFAIGTLGASAAGFALTAATAGNVVQKSPTSATELGFVQGVTSPIQAQLNNKLSLSGGTLTGALTLPDGSPAAPSLNFSGFPQTGLSAASGLLALDTAGSSRITISPSGNVIINQAASGTTLTVTGGGASISGNLTIPSGSGRIITDAITINNAPVAGTDGTNKAYVDSVAVGLQVKAPCRVVDAVNSITPVNFPTIDSVITTTGDRVLLTMETNGVQNGIWQINNGGIWVRPADFPSGGSAVSAYTFIQEGAVFANSSWICTNTIGNATIDTNSLNFVEFSSSQNVTAANVGTGAGVFRDKIGNTLNFRSLNSPDANIVVTQNTNDIAIMLSSNPSISNLIVSGQVSANTFFDNVGTTITGGNVNATNVIATTTVRAGDGSAAFPSIDFASSPLTGFSAQFPDTLVVSTAGANRLQINAAGTINIPAFTPAGIVHNSVSGDLSSSLIVNADVSPIAAIVDTKLATISTAGKVANSATTATSADVFNAIVSRDGAGNFAANVITADSKFLAADGTANLPSISFTNSPGAGLSSPVAGQLALSSGSPAVTIPQILLNAAGNVIQFPNFTPAGIVHNDASGNLSTSLINLATDVTGVLPIVNGGTNSNTTLNNNRIMVSSGGKIVESNPLNNGQLLIGSTGLAPVVANITQANANQVIVTNGAGSITLSTPQDLATISTPTFAGLTVNGPVYLPSLTPSLPLQLNANNQIISAPLTPASFSGILTVTQGGTGSSSLGINAMLASNATGTAVIPLANLANGQLFIGSTGNLPVANTITQASANQVIVTSGAGSITLSTPQDLATISTPTFVSLTLTKATNQLTLGSGNTTTLSASAPAASRVYTIPDVLANAQFVMTEGTQIINGNKTLSGTTNLSGLTASLPLQLDASKNIISAPITPAVFSGILPITNGGTGSSALGTNAMLASNSTGTAVIPLANLTNGQLFIGSTGNLPVANTITQASANQVIVTNGAGSITLATPQDIATTSSPRFASETLTNATNQLILGSGNNVTLSAQSLTLSHTYYFPDVTATSTFVMTDGNQVINGNKTFTGTTTHAAGSAAVPSIQFSGSTNTGISSINTNTLVFSTNGNSRLSIGSDGQTTIAAPSAGTALTVNGLANSATALSVTGTGLFTTGLAFAITNTTLGGNYLNAVGSYPQAGLRMVCGNITSAGVINQGSGFTLAAGGTGVVTVTFTTPFRFPPIITTTVQGPITNNLAHYVLITTTQTPSSVTFTVVNQSGTTAVAGSFSFIAIGQI